MYIASSLVNGVPYKIFICLKSVDLPDSPAPKIRSLILRDSAAQLWVSERESCDGGARVGRAGVDGGEGARACKENDAVAYLAVALAPAAVVGLDGGAAAHVCLCHLDAILASAPVSRFSLRGGCQLIVDVRRGASSSPAGPRRMHNGPCAEGAAQAGAKHSGRFPASAAARGASLPLVWERWRASRGFQKHPSVLQDAS